MVCGIFPRQGSNLCLLHWRADSSTLSHQGSPPFGFIGALFNKRGGRWDCCLWYDCKFPKRVFTGWGFFPHLETLDFSHVVKFLKISSYDFGLCINIRKALSCSKIMKEFTQRRWKEAGVGASERCCQHHSLVWDLAPFPRGEGFAARGWCALPKAWSRHPDHQLVLFGGAGREVDKGERNVWQPHLFPTGEVWPGAAWLV